MPTNTMMRHYSSLFIAVNQEGGLINALTKKNGFKVGKNYSEAKLGKINDPKLAYQQALARGHLLKKSCTFVMVTHLIDRKLDARGLQASLSHKIKTNLLRHKLHFKGLIMTDDMDAAAIRNHVPTQKAIKLAVFAGNDIILYSGTQGYDSAQDTKTLHNTLLELAEKNPNVRHRIIQSYQKLKNVKLNNTDNLRIVFLSNNLYYRQG